MGLDKVLAKFSKKKLLAFVAGVHLVLICILGMSFNFQKPEKEIRLKQLMVATLVDVKKLEPEVKPIEEAKPEKKEEKRPEAKPKPVKREEPKKPKVDKKKAEFALEQKKKLEEERKRQKKLEDERKRKKKLENERKKKAEAKRKKELQEKKERERKEKLRQKKLAEQRRQKALADKRAKETAERVSNGLEATYLQELGQRLNLTWRKPSFGVQVGSYVVVRLTIEKDGRISKAAIRDYRANSTMLASVKDLLKRMKRFKRFPSKITERRITQDFRLEIE